MIRTNFRIPLKSEVGKEHKLTEFHSHYQLRKKNCIGWIWSERNVTVDSRNHMGKHHDICNASNNLKLGISQTRN